MTTVMNNKEGKRLSFYKVFTQEQFHIEVPIIQRDYAQGRPSFDENRPLFLKALHDYLEENRPNRDLDFVYGTVEELDNQKLFIVCRCSLSPQKPRKVDKSLENV